jgi:hypothetical protein
VPARDALKTALRTDVVPVLRTAGFRGTFPTWRLERHGDVALVNVQASKYDVGVHGDFFVNLSVVPPSWWAWTHECAAQTMWGSNSQEGHAREWDGLYRGAARPVGETRLQGWPVDG